MSSIPLHDLAAWCGISAEDLEKHPGLKVPFRVCSDESEMGQIMADELIREIRHNNSCQRITHAILPAGPDPWYEPFARIVNQESISLKNLVVFHMDDCLDWQGRTLPVNHPYNFRTYMETRFYEPVRPELAVPEENRRWLTPASLEQRCAEIAAVQVDITIGGWGQDGHVAYNQARRHPYSTITVDDLRSSTARIQENNLDTIIALAHRTFGGGYQFVPPMSVTLGIRECFSARKVRVFSATGAWKQTALRVALLGPVTAEYPFTLLQEHPDAVITATRETADHPISRHPEWELM